jgi:hypothetical protein
MQFGDGYHCSDSTKCEQGQGYTATSVLSPTHVQTLSATVLQRIVGWGEVVKEVGSLLPLQMLPNLIWLLAALNNPGSLF